MACGDQKVDIGECNVSGTNTTGMNSNYVVQYPKPYRRTDGKWIALATIIGGILGVINNKDEVKKAGDAQDKWQKLTDALGDKGLFLLEYADKLKECNDTLHERLCALALCGFKMDYGSIVARANIMAQSKVEVERRKLCRAADRYNTGMNAQVNVDLASAGIIAAVTSVNAAVENARVKMFEINYKLIRQTAADFEAAYLGRISLGFQFLNAASESYRNLAISYREQAAATGKDWTTLATTIGLILAVLLPSWDGRDKEDACSDEKPPEKPPETRTSTDTEDGGATETE